MWIIGDLGPADAARGARARLLLARAPSVLEDAEGTPLHTSASLCCPLSVCAVFSFFFLFFEGCGCCCGASLEVCPYRDWSSGLPFFGTEFRNPWIWNLRGEAPGAGQANDRFSRIDKGARGRILFSPSLRSLLRATCTCALYPTSGRRQVDKNKRTHRDLLRFHRRSAGGWFLCSSKGASNKKTTSHRQSA